MLGGRRRMLGGRRRMLGGRRRMLGGRRRSLGGRRRSLGGRRRIVRRPPSHKFSRELKRISTSPFFASKASKPERSTLSSSVSGAGRVGYFRLLTILLPLPYSTLLLPLPHSTLLLPLPHSILHLPLPYSALHIPPTSHSTENQQDTILGFLQGSAFPCMFRKECLPLPPKKQ